MPRLTIDGREVEVEEGVTVLGAARKLGIHIPTLCHLQGYEPFTSCMVCLVRMDGKASYVPSCATVATEGMAIESESAEVRDARRTALELLLSDHLGDCIGPCESVCPAHMAIPRMIRHIMAQEWREAVTVAKEHIALPGVMGRICPGLCEKGCRRVQVDEAVSIRLLERIAAERDAAAEERYVPECALNTGKRVAVVGAGPAGLAAAFYLRRSGHAVELIDEHQQMGGALRYSMPEEEMPVAVLDADLATLMAMGVRFVGNRKPTSNADLEALRSEYDAVALAIGETSAEAAAVLGLAYAGKGLRVSRDTGETSSRGVFAAGSCVSPAKQAIRALAAGKDTAGVVDQYVRGVGIVPPVRPYTVHIGKLDDCEIPVMMEGVSAAKRIEPAGGEVAGFTAEEGKEEGRRCMHCDCLKADDCPLRDYSRSYGATPARYKGERRKYSHDLSHPEIVLEHGKCIDCGRCSEISKRAGERLGMTFTNRGFVTKVGVAFDGTLAAGLERSAKGCAENCPTAALSETDGWFHRTGEK